MGRYQGYINHIFSDDPTRPVFGETVLKLKGKYLQWELDKLQPEEQIYVIKKLQESGVVAND